MMTAIDWVLLEELTKMLAPGVLIGLGLSATVTALAFVVTSGFKVMHKCFT